VKAWAAETRKKNAEEAEVVQRMVSKEMLDFYSSAGLRVVYRDGQFGVEGPLNNNAARSIGTWKAKTNAPVDYPLNVNPQLVGLWERSVPGTNHAEFNNGGVARLIFSDTGTNTVFRAHATEMAGTIAAAGIVATAEGMSSASTILAKDNVNDTAEMADASVDFGLRLSNHSYGVERGWGVINGTTKVWNGEPNDFYDTLFGAYKSKALAIDALAYLNKEYLSVWAAGNDRDDSDFSLYSHLHYDGTLNYHTDSHAADTEYYGGYRTITSEASAKNIITVGSILDLTNGWQSASTVTNSPFSNWGPTRDGRLKPEIVANGQDVYSSSTDISGNGTYTTASGTSSATASVTGSIALLRERLAQVGIHNPSAALIKALIFATADDAGNPGPDYQFGFGVMNTDKAADLILKNKYFFNPAGGPLKSHFIEGVLTNGTSWTIHLYTGSGPDLVRATLVWADSESYLANGPTNAMLVNDLDVKIIQSGTTNGAYYLNPFSPPAAAVQGDNVLDNAEQAAWTSTNLTGSITIQISHKGTLKDAWYNGNTTNQPFALVVTGHTIEPVPEIISIAQTSSNQVTLAWNGWPYKYYKVQYIDEVDALASAWSDATGSIQLTTNPAAVALTMPTNVPTRFYRVIRLP